MSDLSVTLLAAAKALEDPRRSKLICRWLDGTEQRIIDRGDAGHELISVRHGAVISRYWLVGVNWRWLS